MQLKALSSQLITWSLEVFLGQSFMAMALIAMANRIFATEQTRFDFTLGLGSVGQLPFYPHHQSFDGSQDRGVCQDKHSHTSGAGLP